MVDINALSGEALPEEVDLDTLPEQFGGGFELPQPGRYDFALPADIKGAIEEIEIGGVLRLKANFRWPKETGPEQDRRLTMTSGQKLNWSVSNTPMGSRPSGLANLLGHGLGYGGKLVSNRDFGGALVDAAGGTFSAKLIWTARNKDTGQRYSTRPYLNKKTGAETKPIPRGADGKFLEEFTDEHGASLRCFPELENFGPAGGGGQ